MESIQSILRHEDSRFLNFVVDKKYRWVRHLLIIGAIVLIHFLPSSSPVEQDKEKENWILVTKLISTLVLLSLFYANHYIFIPKLLLRNRFIAYAGSILAFCSVIFLMLLILERLDLPFIDKGDKSHLYWGDYVVLIILLIVFIAAVSSLKLFKMWIVNLLRFKELENNTLLVQLEQLKSQINPHFLFNTINNINFLIDENPKLASTVLLKLSDILRSQLYLSKGETVPLADEIQVLKNILFMEEIRRDSFFIDFNVSDGLADFEVPHFLFIPFIENVIKHGAHHAMKNGFHVEIKFRYENQQLYFTCINSKKRKSNPEDYGGLGLNNISQRLDIIYPDAYNLQVEESEEVFSVFLSIPMV